MTTPLEAYLWQHILDYAPMMTSTIDARYQAQHIPGWAFRVRGVWLVPLNLDVVTPT